MIASTKARLAGVFAALLIGTLTAVNAWAQATYTIESPSVPIGGLVTSDSVTIKITAPSTALILRSAVNLNGRTVTSALQPDGDNGSMTGTVSGLQVGSNTFQLFTIKTSKVPVAQLVIERGTPAVLSCAAIANIAAAAFPIQPSVGIGGTVITLAQLTAATGGANALPEHCLIRGTLQARIGTAGPPDTVAFRDNQQYATLFEVRLPTLWNGRYMFLGGGGTEGSLPSATGSSANGTNGVPELRNGYAVATQNGGHTTSQLPPTLAATSTSPSILQANMFYTDALAVRDWGYNSIDITTQTAKFLINTFYGRQQDKSYFVGCSTSGRQGMAMSQLFPQHYDGIVAGDPFYLPPDISMSETWGLEQIIKISDKDPVTGNTLYLTSFPVADQQLFTNAILAACDAIDGLVDGVIEKMSACPFDPATFVWPSTGPYGSIAPGQPLQCTGAKTSLCLLPKQVTAAKVIAEGPRTSGGQTITSPDGTLLSGYPFDGGFMQPSGIPTRDIGTPTSPPGNIGLGSGQLPLFWFTVPDPNYNPLTVNYDTDVVRATSSSPAVNKDPNISPFINRGGKLILYHGLSDSGPPWPYSLDYFNKVAALNGGPAGVANFMKLYLIPNMGHCGGNAATDRFDMLAPMVNWIENGIAPNTIVASGTGFSSTSGTLTGLPTTRSRPLCPYPQTLKYNGAGDIALATSYACQP